MNYHEYLQSLDLDTMAATLTALEIKTYNETKLNLAPMLPEMTDKDFMKLYQANVEMLNLPYEESDNEQTIHN